jgi:hypothetical protein
MGVAQRGPDEAAERLPAKQGGGEIAISIVKVLLSYSKLHTGYCSKSIISKNLCIHCKFLTPFSDILKSLYLCPQNKTIKQCG